MIAIIDYGAGNIKSVEKALRFLGASIVLTNKSSEILKSDAAILPGVGAFDDCVNSLIRLGIYETIREFIQLGKPFLGICIGYQVLFEKSFEFNSQAIGLSIFKGNVVRFNDRHKLKVPQIGWNSIEIIKTDCPIFNGIRSGSYFYFVHSFYPVPEDPAIIAAKTSYGDEFASVVWKDNVYATQFHPEKSQKTGLILLSNFINLIK